MPDQPDQKVRRRPSVLGVIGELLITAGVLVLVFLGWQVWWNSLVLAGQQTNAAASQSQKWIDLASASPTPAPKSTTTAGTKPDYGPPPVMDAPADYQPVAVG